jgi:hyaluronan synthase
MPSFEVKSKTIPTTNKINSLLSQAAVIYSQLCQFGSALRKHALPEIETIRSLSWGNLIPGLKKFYKTRSINSWIAFYLLVYVVLLIKFITLQNLGGSVWFKVYSFAISFYILSRFLLSYYYDYNHPKYEVGFYEPTISFGVPAKNEGDNIRKTILKIALSDYPKDKFDVIAVNDGSTDNTVSEMRKAQEIAAQWGVTVKIIDWKINRGKRAGMAECTRQSDQDIMIFVDSDSFVKKNTAREIIRYFTRPEVGAVAGHAFVANAETNVLTKMQAARYFIAFKAYKSAEALFGAVTCCSGCLSAYRRQYVNEVLEEWEKQKFMGVKCTYGDDRSLTNFLLKKGYDTLYNPLAISYTIVPDNMKQFLKQQLRWKKSWVRECLIASTFIWKRHPIMSLSFYLGTILTLVAPAIVLRVMVWYPYTTHEFPAFYLFGLLLMSVIYGAYYNVYIKDRKWLYGVVFTFFYTLLLIWQLPYAILTIRDPRWGTR